MNTAAVPLSTHPALAACLSQYRSGRAFFIPLAGNSGDKLIELGSRFALAAFDLTLVQERREADVIIVNGGAKREGECVGMFGPSSQRCPHIPFIALPSSFLLDADDFSRCFQGRTSPATVFARERYSYEVVTRASRPPNVSCELDHDMAFALRAAPVLEELRCGQAQEHLLVVERFDRECATLPVRPVPGFIKRWVPEAIKGPLRDWRYRRQRRKSGFMNAVLAQVFAEHPEFAALPVVSQDISRDDVCSFEHFLQTVAQAAAVVTTRLHVAILAAMLGKPTYLKRGAGAYRKIQGVYEYSLARYPNVKLLA